MACKKVGSSGLEPHRGIAALAGGGVRQAGDSSASAVRSAHGENDDTIWHLHDTFRVEAVVNAFRALLTGVCVIKSGKTLQLQDKEFTFLRPLAYISFLF